MADSSCYSLLRYTLQCVERKVWWWSGRRRWRSFMAWHLETKNPPSIYCRGLTRSMNTETNIVCSQIQLGGFLCVALLAVNKQFLIIFLRLFSFLLPSPLLSSQAQVGKKQGVVNGFGRGEKQTWTVSTLCSCLTCKCALCCVAAVVAQGSCQRL